ncbi:MAG: metallophosphoesterase [Pseudomonadota bacterium]
MGIFGRFFSAASAAPTFEPPAPARAVYAIGDVHGMAQHLDTVLAMIDADATQRGIEAADLVLVGDYVDRGDDSRAVLERLHELTATLPEYVTCLMGNHERMMLDFLDDPERTGERWVRNGGLQTLASFGVGGITAHPNAAMLVEASAALEAALGPVLRQWLAALPMHWQSGNVAVVHAAADPALPIADQPDRLLLWGCAAFERTPRRDGIWIVHGHTVVNAPGVKDGRISIDTGACFNGHLTAVALIPGEPPAFLTT